MLPRVIHQQQTDRTTGSRAAGGRWRWTAEPVLSAPAGLWVVLCAPGAHAGRDHSPPFYANTCAKPPSAAAMTAGGRQLVFDKSLSASGKMSCASCHDPGRA